MIQIDRDAATPLFEQLAEQLRFLLATGHHLPGDALPSTRRLGRQLDLSFHTVRKAYHVLEAEGLIEARAGSGYHVKSRPATSLADRMERGAAIAQDAVQRMVGLGFDEDEMQLLFEEQLAYLESSASRLEVIAAAPYRELAEAAASQIEDSVQISVTPVVLSALTEHIDADLVIVPHAAFQATVRALPRVDVLPVSIHFPAVVLDEVARLFPEQTLGLVTRHGDAIGPILRELRQQVGFSGPAIALESDADRERLQDLVDQVDLLVYTPQARRSLRSLVESAASVELKPVVDPDSLARVAERVRR